MDVVTTPNVSGQVGENPQISNVSKILVVKTDKFFPKGIKEGFFTDVKGDYLSKVNNYGEFIERDLVENDDTYQQVVAQIVLKVGSKIFIHKIPSSGSEGRLHDLWPIFLGGHVEEYDDDIRIAARREFDEEVFYVGKITSEKYVGILKLHDFPVNKVHVGFVWIYEGDTEKFKRTKDGGVVDGKFVSYGRLSDYQNKMTYWSKLFYPKLSEWM